MFQRVRMVPWLLVLVAGMAWADTPAKKAPALASLETMVGNLGYTPTDSADQKNFSIVWTGKYDYKFHFTLSQDGTLSYAYVDLTTLQPDQLAKLPFTNLFETNDTGDFFYSMESHNGKETLYGNVIIPLDGLTPQSLRTILGSAVAKLDADDKYWDTDLWK
jgi:hypothetical protein